MARWLLEHLVMKTTLLATLLVSSLGLAQPTTTDAPVRSTPEASPSKSPRLLSPGKYRFTGPVPEGFTLVSTPRYELVGTGAGVFAGGYLVSALTAGFLSRDPVGFVPVVDRRASCRERVSSPV